MQGDKASSCLLARTACLLKVEWQLPGMCRPKTRHTSIALYALLRGLGLLIRTGNKADAPPLVHK